MPFILVVDEVVTVVDGAVAVVEEEGEEEGAADEEEGEEVVAVVVRVAGVAMAEDDPAALSETKCYPTSLPYNYNYSVLICWM